MNKYAPALLALLIVPVVFVVVLVAILSPRLTAGGERERLMELLSSTVSTQERSGAGIRTGFSCDSVGIDCADVGSWSALQAADGSEQSLAELCEAADQLAAALPVGSWHVTSRDQEVGYGGVPSEVVEAMPLVADIGEQCLRGAASVDGFRISAVLERSVRVKDGSVTITVSKDSGVVNAPWELWLDLDGAPAW